jgi:general secretion pathway protein L
MAERLIIRLREKDEADWLVLDERDNRVGTIQSSGRDALAAQSVGRRVIVLVPGEAVTLVSVKLPSRNAQKVEKALPFALEERLAEDVDQLHFAFGAAAADGSRPVAVVRRTLMDAWLAALTEANVRPDAILPETLAIPTTPDEWHIVVENNRVVVREDQAAGFAADPMTAPDLIALKLKDGDGRADTHSVVVHAAEPTGPTAAAVIDACQSLGGEKPEVDELPGGSGLQLAGAGLASASGMSLLSGAYKPRRGWEQGLRRWRLPATLAAAWLIAAIAWQGVEYYQLHQRRAHLDGAIATQFQQALPGHHRMVNPRAQLTTRLNALKAASGSGPSNGLIGILSALGKGLTDSARVTTLSWHEGVLDVSVTTPDVEALNKLRSQLARQTGRQVKIEQASAKGKNFNGRLRIGKAS